MRTIKKKDATKRAGHSGHQNILVVLQWLATGKSFEDIDDTVRMLEESINQACIIFCARMVQFFSHRYLQRPLTPEELRKIERKYMRAGFPGCMGAFDCCKIHWKNCPEIMKERLLNSMDGKLAVISVES